MSRFGMHIQQMREKLPEAFFATLFLALLTIPLIVYAATTTWTLQADFSGTHSDTSATLTPGSVSLDRTSTTTSFTTLSDFQPGQSEETFASVLLEGDDGEISISDSFWYIRSTPVALPDQFVEHAFVDTTNDLIYVAMSSTDGGVSVIDTQGTEYPSDDEVLITYNDSSTPAIPNDTVRHVALDETNDLLYISQPSSSTGGLSVINTQGTVSVADDTLVFTYDDSSSPAIAHNSVEHTYLDTTNNLVYVSTGGGGVSVINTQGTISAADDTLVFTYDTLSSPAIAGNDIDSTFLDTTNNLLYVATDGAGLSVINTQGTVSAGDDTLVTTYNTGSSPALPTDTVQHAFLDSSNNLLYVSTFSGLTVINTQGTVSAGDDTLVITYDTGSSPSITDDDVAHTSLDSANDLLYLSTNTDGVFVIDTQGTVSSGDDTLVDTYDGDSTPAIISGTSSTNVKSTYIDTTNGLLYVAVSTQGISVIRTDEGYFARGVYRSAPIDLSATPVGFVDWEETVVSGQDVAVRGRTGDTGAAWVDDFNDGDTTNLEGDPFSNGFLFNVFTEAGGTVQISDPADDPSIGDVYVDTGQADNFWPAGSMITLRVRSGLESGDNLSLYVTVDNFEVPGYPEGDVNTTITDNDWHIIQFRPDDPFRYILIEAEDATDTFAVGEYFELDWIHVIAPDGDWNAWSSSCSTAPCTLPDTSAGDYFQYELALTTSDGSARPEVTDTTVGSYEATGTYTHPSITLTDQVLESFAAVTTEPTDTDVTFEYSIDGGAWTAMTAANATHTFSSEEPDTFQWRTTLTTTDIGATPTLDEAVFITSDASSGSRGGTKPRNNPPDVTINGPATITLRDGASYIEFGARARDKEDGNLTDEIIITGVVNSRILGVYAITYSVTDSGGLSDSETRMVIVEEDVAECGNSIIEPGEQCDGSIGCTETCELIEEEVLPFCGDGIVQEGEECDPGVVFFTHEGTVLPQTCSQDCTLIEPKLDLCGNGVVDPGEECDPNVVLGRPDRVGSIPTCTDECTLIKPFCGDEEVNQKHEQCDPPQKEECTITCQVAFEEICDDGIDNDADGKIDGKDKDCKNRNTPPAIHTLGPNPVRVKAGFEYKEFGARAHDAEDGNITDQIITTGTVDDTTAGIYTIEYSVTDSEGLSASTERIVTVEAINTPPNITLNGQAEMALLIGEDEYIELGSQAHDAEDGNITDQIITTGTVDDTTAGIYTIEYSVTDSEGLSASTERTVTLSEPPVPPPVCGNDIVEAGEICDGETGCANDCSSFEPFCGNEVIDLGEECDGGDTCTNTCTLKVIPSCGDGIINQEWEECDVEPGAPGSDSCNTSCEVVIEEICDDGIDNDADGKTDYEDPDCPRGRGATNPPPISIPPGELPVGEPIETIVKMMTVVSVLLAGGFSVISLTLSPISAANTIFDNIRMNLYAWLGLRRMDKDHPWGTIYDSKTKQPLDPVHITAISEHTGKEVKEAFTDLDGRYGFLLEQGEYELNAEKTHYTFPSEHLLGKEKDLFYDNLYFGGSVTIEDEKEPVVTKNIPMDAKGFDWNEYIKSHRKEMKFFSALSLKFYKALTLLYYTGFVLAAIIAFVEQSLPALLILLSYVLVFMLRHIDKTPTSHASLIDKETHEPLSFAHVSVFNEDGYKMKDIVSDHLGRFYCLVRPGKYYLEIKRYIQENTYADPEHTQLLDVKNGIINGGIGV